MIDLHCHILPAVDDGSDNITQSLKMAEQAYSEGIDKILLTPHHMDSEYVNHPKKVEEMCFNLQKIFKDNSINIDLRAGQEVHLNGSLIDEIERGDILYPDGDSKKYIMLELPHSGVPEYTNDMIFEIIVRGITPVIVHPERNKGFQKNPDKLYDIVSQGCLTQLTATSYVGGFGKDIEMFTEQIINSGLGHLFSSDAHNLSGRRFRMQEAFEKLEKNNGKETVLYFKKNAEDIWYGNKINAREFYKIKKQSSFINKIRKFLK